MHSAAGQGHDINRQSEVGGDSGDEAAAADRDQHRVQRAGLVVELEGEGGLAEYGLPLVVGGHAHRAGRRDPLLRGLQRVGVTIACDHQVRQLADALDLGRGGHGGHEDPGRDAQPARGIRDGDAVVAARRGRDPGRRHVPAAGGS